MATGVHLEALQSSFVRKFARASAPWSLCLLFAVLVAVQTVGFLVLGAGRWGSGLAESVVVAGNLIALACAWHALRRAQGVTAIFWFLFAFVLVVWLVPNALWAYDTLFDRTTLSDAIWRLLYCLYGAPILMMLFLPDSFRPARMKSEILLDLFQVGIVVSLVYSTFFFLPAQRMLPAEATLHDLSISDAQSIVLLLAVLVRLQFARAPGARRLLQQFALFLLVCAVFTFIGNWIDRHNWPTATAWFNVAWNLNQAAPALFAITWQPSQETEWVPEPANFGGFLGTNLVLITMLSGMHLLAERWKAANGELVTDIAISACLLAFSVRLALTQFHQQREIAQRIAAQEKLMASHKKIGELLDDARRQTDEITRISELGSLLHACTSREEIFRLIPERLRRMFPGASGSIAMISVSKTRVESVAKWGAAAADPMFTLDQCWSLRRGTVHTHSGRLSDPRCSHLLGEGPSVCIPLIANGQAIGTLSLQDDETPNTAPAAEGDDTFARRCHVASTVAEHIALAFANLSLRESLRLEAVHDPLTGLYNRRYMQEFLEHELHSARRKHRPLAVLMLDLDLFKRYNDNFGHAAGDQALVAVGEALQRSVRDEDIACRYGGDEFTLILPECSLAQATVRAEEIRQRLKHCFASLDGQAEDVLTVSVGIAAFDETTDRVDLLLKFADEALYQAKRAGRNRIVAARPACALPDPNFAGKPLAKAASADAT